MKGVFKSISDLPKHYIELILARIGALLMLFAILIILTMFGAFVMLTRWQWTPEQTFLVCFIPWLSVFLILIIVSCITSHRIKEDKQQIYEAGKQHLFMQIFGLLFANLFKKSKKCKHKHKDEEDSED